VLQNAHTWRSEERWLTVAGTRLRVAVSGEGPPLLLLMGIGGNLDMWGPITDHLPGRQLIAFDAPGTGASPFDRPRRMPGLADLAAGLLDALEIDRTDVLGYSFGGALAQQLAHSHPDRVSRLILGATMCGLGGLPARPEVLFHLSHPLRYTSKRYLRWVSPRIYGGMSRRSPEAGAEAATMAARLSRPPSTIGYVGQLWAIWGWSSLPWLPALEMPTLILAGDDDPIIPLFNARILSWRLPNAQLHVVKGGGHLFLLDQAEDIAGVIDGFLGHEEAEPVWAAEAVG
jgi:poly(3-hydroxyoctanoate) depolymerase